MPLSQVRSRSSVKRPSECGVNSKTTEGTRPLPISHPVDPAAGGDYSTDEAELKASCEKASRKNVFVATSTVAVFSFLAAILCLLAPSDDTARTVAYSPQLEPAYIFGLASYGTYLISEALKLWVAADDAHRTLTAPTAAVAVCGTVTATLHLFGYAPVWAISRLGDDGQLLTVLPLRHLTWAVTTGLLAYIVWVSAVGVPVEWLYRILAMQGAMICCGLLSSLTTGWLSYSLFALACAVFYCVGFLQWRMYGAAIDDCAGLHKAKVAIRRMRLLTVVVWHMFPVLDLLHRAHVLDNLWTELLTAAADVISKSVMSSALAHGALSTAADRKHLRMQQMSIALVEQLREQDKRKGRFFSIMTHELRTPLNGMIGLIDTLLASEAMMSAKCRKSLTLVSGTGRRFQKLINNILDQASLQEDKLKLMQQPMSVHQLVEEVTQLIEPLMSSEAELVVELPTELPLVYGDYTRLMQVMFNLMGNAAKFTVRGRVIVSAKVPSAGSSMLELAVSDTGIGIEKKDLQSVFEPFEQVDQSHSRLHGGTGLGLSLASKLVQAHGGEVTVDSVVGIGTRFTLTLPLYRAKTRQSSRSTGGGCAEVQHDGVMSQRRRTLEKEFSRTLDTLKSSEGDMRRLSDGLQVSVKPRRSTNPSVQSSLDSLRNYSAAEEAAAAPLGCTPRTRSFTSLRGQLMVGRHQSRLDTLSFIGGSRDGGSVSRKQRNAMEILSVDDDALNQQVIQELMASDGFRVTHAMSGDQALEILERRFLTQGGVEHFPDIILMDLMMPGSTGREATQKIRELYPSSNIPIIMVSAIDDEVEICAGLRAGCNDYVTKPFRHLELRARVQLQLRIVDYYRQSLAAKQDERILMEILPRSVLDRLKSGQSMIADELSDVSVVFSDIVGFTEMTARHSTLEIISMLDELFTKFDALVELHCSYKVETIGDAYMIACGLNSQEGHALTAINLAVDMVSAAASMRVPSGAPLRIRVGIHSGTAYAGVVGQKCPRYCLFGDTVNTASRMESHGFPMTVHISDATFQRACMEEFNTYGFHDLGQRAIKGKGHMQTWLVEEGEWIAAVHDFEKNLCSRSRSSRALLNYYRVSFDSESAAGTPSRSSNGESVHDSLSSLEADGLELDVRSPAPLLASTSPVTNDSDDDGEEGASKS